MTECQSVPLLLSVKIARSLAIKESKARNATRLGHLHARLLPFKSDKHYFLHFYHEYGLIVRKLVS